MAVCALTLFLALPSHAGHWVITYSGSTISPLYPANATGYDAVGNYTFVNSHVTGPSPWRDQIHPSFSLSSDQCFLHSHNQGVTSISVVAKLIWTLDDPGDTTLPPPTVDVREEASAGADTMPNDEHCLDANDSLNDDPIYIANGSGVSSAGSHLTHYTLAPGQTVITLPARLVSGFMSLPQVATESNSTITPGVSVSYAVYIDNRAVAITSNRDNPTPTTYKYVVPGVFNANGDPAYEKYTHAPEADGTMRADIGLDFGDADLGNSWNYEHITYTGNPSGNWAENESQYLWNTSLKNASYPGTLFGVPPDPGIETLTNAYREPYILKGTNDDGSPMIPPLLAQGDAGTIGGAPVTDHIFFSYTNGDNRPSRWTPYTTGNDGDGAIAKASYWVYIHPAFELLPSVKHGILQPGEDQENIVYQNADLDIKASPSMRRLEMDFRASGTLPVHYGALPIKLAKHCRIIRGQMSGSRLD